MNSKSKIQVTGTTNYRKPFSNVPSVEPAILVDSFSGFLRILEIPFEDVRSLCANLRTDETININ